LHSMGYKLDSRICIELVKYNQFHALAWFHSIGGDILPSASEGAVRYGRADVLKWMHSEHIDLSFNVCTIAAMRGDIDVMEFMHGYNSTCFHDCIGLHGIFNILVDNGHLHAIVWAIDHGFPYNRARCICSPYAGIAEWACTVDLK